MAFKGNDAYTYKLHNINSQIHTFFGNKCRTWNQVKLFWFNFLLNQDKTLL